MAHPYTDLTDRDGRRMPEGAVPPAPPLDQDPGPVRVYYRVQTRDQAKRLAKIERLYGQ